MLGEDAMTTYSHSMENHLIILFSICQWILAFFPRLVPRFFVFIPLPCQKIPDLPVIARSRPTENAPDATLASGALTFTAI